MEQRSHERMERKIECSLFCGESELKAKTRNISNDGALIVIEELPDDYTLHGGDAVTLQFSSPSHGSEKPARIVRVFDLDDQGIGVALAFIGDAQAGSPATQE